MSTVRLPPGQRLVLATHNDGKVGEFRSLLGRHGIDIVTAGSLGLPEPEETGTTFHANAALKARAAATACNEVALADDSGIVVAGLDGAPGIHSARWAGPERDFTQAMRKVTASLAERFGSFKAADTKATFVAVLCLASPDGRQAFFEGRVDGHLVEEPRGEAGFGYDPIFVPEGESRTFAEMTPAEKRTLSHRARAIEAMLTALFPTEPPRERPSPSAPST